MNNTFIFSILLIILFSSCYKEEVLFDSEPNNFLELDLILKINNKDCSFDRQTNTLRYPVDKPVIKNFEAFIEFQEYSTVYFNNLPLLNNRINDLGLIEINKDYNLRIITNNVVKELIIQFTILPIIQIITHDNIVDEPKMLARILVNDPLNTFGTSYIGIEHKGESSQAYPKKSFLFSFLDSQFTNDIISKSIFNLPKNSHWWLDAMFIDPSRLRNKFAFDLWRQFEGFRNYGIHSFFVELYINSEHQGLYCLNENLNSELLEMTSDYALLYKAIDWDGPNFAVYSPVVSTNKFWNNWEQKFPNPLDKIDWGDIMFLTDLVVNSIDSSFVSQIHELISIDNFIDYHILLNLISALDNTGKNNFLARNFGEDPFFMIPWDLEGSFGLMANGDYVDPTHILSNKLYDRLFQLNPANFKNRLTSRWLNLRADILSINNLMNTLENNFNYLDISDIILIENREWNLDINILEEKERISNWLYYRVNFLDNYYLNL